ncbi:efflux transporter outer membrane subunit [Dyella tabacisoli]|uniref:RND transporter n=2 Tax=Dyella tabacisoli TaxID=2282381 RepID=A0A369UK27_9GAMM|nr:RND transporter [Dyella tabacisoli]
MKHAPHYGRWTLVAALAVALIGCSIPTKLERAQLRDDVPLAGLQTSARAGWPDAEWWRIYQDPQLDTLIALAMKQSPDLAQAHSRVLNAEQSVRLTSAQMGLSINGSAQVTRQRLSEHGLMPPAFLGFTWYNQADLGVQFQYDFDWWGKKRASIEAALDQARSAEAQRSAAALTIQNAVADTYFGWQADQSRLTLAAQAVANQEKLVRIAELRVRQGVDLADTTQQAKAQLAATRQLQVTIDSSGQIRKVALAALLGIAPDQLPPLQPRALPEVRSGIPADARLDLIARRPDIAASRWQVESALRQTDAARAQFFPDISITALVGLSSTNQGAPSLPGLSAGGGGGDLGNLFSSGSRVLSLTPALHLPIFESGRLQANYGVSRAQLDAAVAQYNGTVVNAAREVSSQALGAEQLVAQRKEQALQLAANERLLASAQARSRQGVRDAREGLAATAQWLQQKDNAVSLHAQALSTDLSLIKALGGGYRLSSEAVDSSSTHSSTTGDADHERH